MFEKETEEEINKEHWNYSIFKDLAQEYWRKGAEFGYNKANEWQRPKLNGCCILPLEKFEEEAK